MLKLRKKTPDWRRLHSALRDAYAANGAVRMRAAVDNHSDRKEAICRRLGVVSGADVLRIASELKKTKIREGAP